MMINQSLMMINSNNWRICGFIFNHHCKNAIKNYFNLKYCLETA
nr:MAG TPA: hypothetical protein [Caudoviricetes sp.]